MKRPPDTHKTARQGIVVDRIDGAVATFVFEGRTYSFPRALLPRGTKEGDALRICFERDDEATLKMRNEIGSRLERLREGDGGGDESL
jgi:hypothetical protein